MAIMDPHALICAHAQIMSAPIYVCSTGELVDATDVTITVPDEARYVVFDRDDVSKFFYASFTGTASVPSTLDDTGASSVANPREWYLGEPSTGREISIITSTAGAGLIVTLSFATALTAGNLPDPRVGY